MLYASYTTTRPRNEWHTKRKCVLQNIVCLEEGTKKGHLHIQSAFAMPFAPYKGIQQDLRALIRLMCGLKKGEGHSWNVVVKVHPENPALQTSLHKVTRAALFGYCTKQRNECAMFR
jgi:hypothetical protein